MTRRNKQELIFHLLNLLIWMPALIAMKNTDFISVASVLLLAYASVYFDLMDWILDSL